MAEPALKQDNDPSAAPPSANPFDQIDPGGQGSQAAPSANPFDDVGPKLAEGSSALGAFRRGVERNIVPAIGSFPAIGAGAEAGATVGAAVGGPFAPITAPVGGLLGGIAGAYLGSTALSSAQHWALSKMPDSWREAIGMDDRQERLDEGQHPVASFLGGLTPYAMTMRPGALGMKGPQLPENATALQRIIANPVTARVFGGAAMGGMELGNEAGSGESPDWTKVAIATGFGLVFNKPTRIGEGLTEIGARPMRGILGRPEPTAVAPPAAAPTEAPPVELAAPLVRPAGITEKDWNETLLGQKQPTVAEAADTNVAGPGITEATFLGGEERSTEAALTAHDTARAEDSVTKEPKQQDVHDIARRIEPETFERYDTLTARRDEFRRWIDEFNTPPPEAFQDLERQRADLQTQHDEHVASQGGYEGGKEARRLRAQIRDVEAQRNALAERATKYMGGEAEETPDLAQARKHLMDTEYELRDLAPQVRAAYGRAADAIGAGTVPPEPVQPAAAAPAEPVPAAGPPAPPLIPDQAPPAAAAGPVAKPIADQKAFIAQDVARQMVAAGRPADEADAAGKLVAARYETRAARLKGAIGTAEELYRTESAEIRGPGGKRAPPAPPSPAVKLAAEFKPGPAPKAPEAPIPESEITTTAVGPKASRGARARDPSTWSLMEYLVDRGGISPDEKNISDLRSIFGKNNKFVPGFGQLIRPGGMSLDRALEAAVEAGYIHDEGRATGGETQVGHKDLTDLLALEERGQKQYRIGQEAKTEGEDPAERAHQIENTLNQALTEREIPPASVAGKLRERVIEIMDKEGATDPISAWERAVMEQDEHAARAGEIEPRTESLPGWDVPDDAGAARGAGPAAQAEQVAQREGAGPAAPAPGEGTAQARELAQEPGAEGKPQGLIPGIEPVTDAQRAQLEANRPLQGGAEPAGGMFDEAARDQKEFWQRSAGWIDKNGDRRDPHETPTDTSDKFAAAVKANTPEGFKFRDTGWKRRQYSSYPTRSVGIQTPEGGFTWAVLYKNQDGSVTYQQHDTSLPQSERGKGIGDKIVGALIKGMKEVGASEVPIHVNSNPDFWSHMDQKYGGNVYAGEGLYQGARGKIQLMEGRKPIITLMKDANASTFIHETGHQWLEEMLRDADHPAAPADLKADAATVRKWVGAAPGGNLKTAHHEKFARGFEQYLREGTAPSQELAGVFARFKDWLLRIYQTISGLGKPINEDIRSVFDRMLAEEPKRTVLAPERAGGPTLADIHEVDAQHTEPAEAEPAMDRVLGEAARAEAELPPQVQHELETKIAEAEAARAAAAGAEPAGQGGAGAGQPAEVEPAGGGPKPEPAGGAGGEEPGKVVPGGAEAGGQGTGVPEPERGPAGGAGPDANPLAPTPARVLEPREPKLVDKAGNIRIENLTSVSDIAQAIRESAERNADFQAVRGQATMGEMMNLADAISIDPAKIDEGQLANLFGGYENMAPKIWALRKALVDSAQIVSNAMKLVREDASDANAAAMALAMTRHDMMQSMLSKATAESGRTLGMAFKNLEGWENAQDLDQFMKANTGRTLFQLKMIAKLGAQLDTPAKVSKFLRDAQKRSFPGMILEYWINGLISGIATHTTYMMGNTGLAAIRAVPETLVAAAIGRLREAGGEQGAHVKFGEVPAGLMAAVRGMPAAFEATLEAARSGVTTLLPGEKARPSMPFAGENQIVVGKNATNEPVTWGDVKNQVSGIMRGLRDGIVANAALLSAGGEQGAPMIGAMYSPLGQIPDIGIRGVNVLPLGTIARIPSRGIAAIHSFFRSVNFSIEKGRDAYRTAAAEGLQGEAFDRRAGQVWSEPTEEQMAKYRFESTEATLMGQGGAFTQKLSQLMNVEVGGWRPLKFIDPFVHISSNIIKQTIVERTPAGLLSPEIRADLMGRPDPITGKIDIAARDMAQARMLVGTALGVTFAGLASQGVISGSGPKDRNEAAMWRLAGNQAHSVRIGDTWWDMHRLGPLGMLLGISADMYELAHKVEEGEYLDAAQHLQHAITQNVLDESFMRGPASLIQAIEDPDRYGQAYIKNTLASFIPFSVGLSQQARAMDPYTRQTRTVVDAIRQKIPGHLDTLFGAELFPHRDIWGEPMPNPDALIKAGLTAIYAKQMSNDPVNKAMLELGIGPAPVARKIRNVDLDDKQYDDFARLSGRMTKQRLDVIVRSADWNSWTPSIKGTIVQEVIKQSREAARGVMMMKYPDLVRAATQSKIDAFREEPEPIR